MCAIPVHLSFHFLGVMSMDPHEALRLYRCARNSAERKPHREALRDWYRKGGFMPTEMTAREFSNILLRKARTHY